MRGLLGLAGAHAHRAGGVERRGGEIRDGVEQDRDADQVVGGDGEDRIDLSLSDAFAEPKVDLVHGKFSRLEVLLQKRVIRFRG